MYKLDLSILKAITSNRMIAMDFAYRYESNIFHPKLQRFAKTVINYTKVYRSLPSRRTLIERHSTEDIEEYLNFVWDKIEELEYNIEDYQYDLEQIKKRHTEQSIVGIKDKINNQLFDEKLADPHALLKEIYLTTQKAQSLFKEQGFIQQSLKDFAPEFEEVYKAKETDPLIGLGIPTGYADVDAAIDGMHATELMVIGGASGSGKSMLLNNMAANMWMGENTIDTNPSDFVGGHNVLYFSLEMPYDLCFNRTMAKVADVRSRELKKGTLSETEKDQVRRSLEFIKNYPKHFEIVDIPRNVDINQIELRFEDAKHKYDPEIIVVDYLGLMDDDDPVADWLKLGVIAGKLHEFARAHNIILLTAVQLNDGTDDKMKTKGKVGLHRIGRSRLIAHNANVVLQIEDRKDEHEYDDFCYHLIKNRDAPTKHKCYLRKKFTHATLLNPGVDTGGESDREDISDLVSKANASNPDGYDKEFISED